MKNLMIVAVLLLFSASLFAQKPSLTPEERALLITSKMKESGLIAEDQFDPVYEVNLKTEMEKQAKREAFRAKREAFQKEMKSLEENRLDAYKDILTPDQMRELKIARAKRKVAMARKKKLMGRRKAMPPHMHKAPFPPVMPSPAGPAGK